MIFEYISPLAASAALLYALSLAACSKAARTASVNRQFPWQARVWTALAFLFAALLASRLFGLEEALRETLRTSLRDGGNYGARRELQSWIAGSFLVLAICGAAYGLNALRQNVSGRRATATYVALLAGVSMVLLVIVRLISLHVTDGLLYGPLKLNWVFDIGLTIIAAGLAVHYTKIVRQRHA